MNIQYEGAILHTVVALITVVIRVLEPIWALMISQVGDKHPKSKTDQDSNPCAPELFVQYM